MTAGFTLKLAGVLGPLLWTGLLARFVGRLLDRYVDRSADRFVDMFVKFV